LLWATDQATGVDALIRAIAECHLSGLNRVGIALSLLQQTLANFVEKVRVEKVI
jgi:hypothetical protein